MKLLRNYPKLDIFTKNHNFKVKLGRDRPTASILYSLWQGHINALLFHFCSCEAVKPKILGMCDFDDVFFFFQVLKQISIIRRKSFIRPHKAEAGRRLAPALHSKVGHRICSRSHEECVLTWLACCDRPQDYSFLVTMGANGVLGLFIDIKALTSNAHFKVDWPTWGINNNWLLH